jgi:hypothetical protein
MQAPGAGPGQRTARQRAVSVLQPGPGRRKRDLDLLLHGEQRRGRPQPPPRSQADRERGAPNAKKQIEQLGPQPLDGVGDIAGIGTDTANGKTYNIVVFAVAREIGLFTLSPADRSKAITLAKRLAGELD